MTMDSEEIHGIIQAYNIPINASTLRSAAEDEEQWRLLTEWTKSHLTPDTLLTKDELNSCVTMNPTPIEDINLKPDTSLLNVMGGQRL